VKRLADDANVGSSARTTTFGGRSISVFDGDTGALLWDSGNSLQTIAVAAGLYDDTRSDDKGPELSAQRPTPSLASNVSVELRCTTSALPPHRFF